MTDYFLAEYNLRLQTNLPCINAGSEKKQRWLPMEVGPTPCLPLLLDTP